MLTETERGSFAVAGGWLCACERAVSVAARISSRMSVMVSVWFVWSVDGGGC